MSDDARKLVKQMIIEEGGLLLSRLNSSESVTEECAPSNPPLSKKRKLGAWLEKAGEVLKMMIRGSHHH